MGNHSISLSKSKSLDFYEFCRNLGDIDNFQCITISFSFGKRDIYYFDYPKNLEKRLEFFII